jgi:hypothetical protein
MFKPLDSTYSFKFEMSKNYFSRGFHNNQWESVARMFQDITNTIYDTLLIFQCYVLGILLSKDI